MNAPRKFLFETTFEPAAAPGGRPHAKKKPAKEFTEEDLAAARNEGFAAGQQAGQKAADETIERHLVQTLANLSQQFTALTKAQAEIETRRGREAVAAAVSVIRKLFPKLAEAHGLAEIEAIVAECLHRLHEEPRVVIRVADPLLDAVNERVTALAAQAGFEGKIVLLAQNDLRVGDARVEWADGGAERDSDQLWRKVDDVIERVIGTAPRADTKTSTNGAQNNPKASPLAHEPDRPKAVSL